MKILNFGSLNIDYFYSVDHFMQPGETQSSHKLEVFCGGKGLNQSIALSRSGVEVWHAGCVGKSDSKILLSELESAGVKTDYIKKVEGNSGHAIIQKDQTGQNSILLYGGANEKITEEDVKNVLSYFKEGDFLILQNEISSMKLIMEQAHEKGINIVFNPSPMNEAILNYPLAYVNYFILNEVEAKILCGIEGNGQALVEKLASMYDEAHIILTLGEKGVIYRYKDIKLEQGIYKVDVLDTTGAGDTFTGYFIGSIIQGKSVEEALIVSSKASAIAVSRIGASPSIPKKEEVYKFKV